MKTFSVILIFVFLYGCATTQTNQQSFSNENLLQSIPLPNGEWTAYQKKEKNMLETMWKKEGSGDFAKTFVLYNETSNTMSYKESDDGFGRKNCDEFKSEILKNETENGYPALTWYSECKRIDGFYTKTINKAIKGNDSTYVLKRVWRNKPEENDWNTWVDYYAKIIACDSRGNNHPCPEGYKKVKGN